MNTMGICIRRRHLTGKNTGQSMRSAMQMFWMRWRLEEDIAGCFGWCMFDYNTTRISEVVIASVITESWICSAIRNWRLAVYACQQEKEPDAGISSSMDIGEHRDVTAGNLYFTNADKVRMYKMTGSLRSTVPQILRHTHLKHGPILIDDFIGDAPQEEHMKPGQESQGVKKSFECVYQVWVRKASKVHLCDGNMADSSLSYEYGRGSGCITNTLATGVAPPQRIVLRR